MVYVESSLKYEGSNILHSSDTYQWFRNGSVCYMLKEHFCLGMVKSHHMSIKFSTTVNTILGEVLRNAHAKCIPSFSSPVVFFSSRVRDSSAAINAFISSMVIIHAFLLISLNPHGFEYTPGWHVCLPLFFERYRAFSISVFPYWIGFQIQRYEL